MKKLLPILTLFFLFTSCELLNQVSGAYQLMQCDYKYNNISDIQVAGVNLGSGTSLSLSNFAAISSILTGGSLQTIPFSMTLKLDVENPNKAAALLNALDYAIQINDMEFVQGKLDVPLRVEPGETAVLPISIGLDLKSLMNQYSRDKVSKEMSGFLGLTSEKTKVSVKLWPKLMVGGTLVKVPAAIPVEFSFGGK